MTATNFTWDPLTDSVIEEFDDLGNVQVEYTNQPTAFGPLLSQNRGGIESYYHFDALGSTVALTDGGQVVTDTYTDDAWGNEVASTGTTPNRFRWVGRWGYCIAISGSRAAVRRRDYVPSSGRWSSADPIGFDAADLNLYRYAVNSPSGLVDPSGEFVIVTCILVVGGVIVITTSCGCSRPPNPPKGPVLPVAPPNAPVPPQLPPECRKHLPKANDPIVNKAADDLATCISQAGNDLRKLAACIKKKSKNLSCDVAAKILACIMVHPDPCKLNQQVWNNCQACCDKKMYEKAAKDMCEGNLPSAIRFRNMQADCYITDCGKLMPKM